MSKISKIFWISVSLSIFFYLNKVVLGADTQPDISVSNFNGKEWQKLWDKFENYQSLVDENCIKSRYRWEPQFLEQEVISLDSVGIKEWQKKITQEFSQLHEQLLICHNFSSVGKSDNLRRQQGAALFERIGATAILYGHQKWILDRLVEKNLQLLTGFYQYLNKLSNPKLPDQEATQRFILISQGFEFIWRVNQVKNKEYLRFFEWSKKHRDIKFVSVLQEDLRFNRKDIERLNYIFHVLNPFLNQPQLPTLPQELKLSEIELGNQPLVPEDFYDSIYSRNNLLDGKSRTSILSNSLIVFSNLTWGITNTIVGLVLTAALMPFEFVGDLMINSDDPAFRCVKLPSVSTNKVQVKMGICPIMADGVSLGLIQLGRMDWHEGGHAYQSAILGPLYLPAVLGSYLIEGRGRGFFENWADDWRDQNGTLKALRD